MIKPLFPPHVASWLYSRVMYSSLGGRLTFNMFEFRRWIIQSGWGYIAWNNNLKKIIKKKFICAVFKMRSVWYLAVLWFSLSCNLGLSLVAASGLPFFWCRRRERFIAWHIQNYSSWTQQQLSALWHLGRVSVPFVFSHLCTKHSGSSFFSF